MEKAGCRGYSFKAELLKIAQKLINPSRIVSLKCTHPTTARGFYSDWKPFLQRANADPRELTRSEAILLVDFVL